MCARGVFLGVLVILLSVLLVKCRAQSQYYEEYGTERTEETNKTYLFCYVCNSEYHPGCGDPFNSHTIASINCSHIALPEHLVDVDQTWPNSQLKPTVCRKIIQKVENYTTRVIRECGFIQDDHDDKKCFSRTGTKDILVTYCSCTKSLCNIGINIRPSLCSVCLFLFPIVYLGFKR